MTTTTTTLTTPELREGMIVHAHGMRCLLDSAPKLSQVHPGGQTFYVNALVLNRDEVSNDSVPYSFTEPRLSNGYPDTAAIARGEHRWTIQGNELARWCVEA